MDGGAAFINQGIHTVDLLINLMGPAVSVFANVQTRVHKIEGEDVGAALINYKNKAIGTITAGTALFMDIQSALRCMEKKEALLWRGVK
ncbi:Gfo/Idh/MocA family protein [Zobellia laminariae]|uniref:Gfo/Idh/MocA family protein n=1 Tax=Zobellia laminariae TaxID=248906 RepID=UPI0034CE73F1